MAYLAKLTRGARYLDINAGRYSLDDDFTPPATNLVPTIATGTSANRTGGGRKIGERAIDRAWSFVVHIDGASDAEVARGANDIAAMLTHAGDRAEPLYFEFKANTDTPEPLWGNYGSNLKYEIIHASPPQPVRYGVSTLRTKSVPHTVALTIKPYAAGLRQRLASATGGILEDTIGTVDGKSRGTIIPEVATNKMTNPVFGHSTWNNGWTAGSSLIAEENTDKRFLLPGTTSSAKVTRNASVDAVFRQSINVGNVNAHILSCYAKRADGAAVSGSDLNLYYNVTLTTAFTAVGDGWYRLTASATGINAATDTGIAMAAVGRSVYVTGFQIEENSIVTPLAYGDLLGCAWTGTAHASTSTRTATRCSIAVSDSLSIAQGTIRIVWRTANDNTIASDLLLMDTTGNVIRFYFRASDDAFVFEDNTNTIATSSQTFSSGDILIFHLTFGPSGLVIYKNGSSVASGASYTPPSLSGSMFIGSSTGPGSQNSGTYMDFATFDVALTSTQVTNDYTNIAQLVADDQRVGCVPWLWSSDGDDDVVNHDDGDANDDNWIVCGGIPGNAPAETLWRITPSVVSKNYYGLLQTLVPYGQFALPRELETAGDRQWYVDFDANADATASGGGTSQVSITTLGTSSSMGGITPRVPLLHGGATHYFVRMRRFSGSTDPIFTTRYALNTAASGQITGDQKTLSMDSTYRLYYLGSMRVGQYEIVDSFNYVLGLSIYIHGTGSAVTVDYDYMLIVNGKFARMYNVSSVTSGWTKILMEGRRVVTLTSENKAYAQFELIGDPIELEPDMLNMIWSLIGIDGSDTSVITDTMTFDRVLIRPRWSLL